MCFKSDDILNFDITFKELSKSMNMYRTLFFITTNYILIDASFIYIYNTICDYIKTLSSYFSFNGNISTDIDIVYYT